MEHWVAVPGYEGLYEVSNRGRVRSLSRNTTTGRILTPVLVYKRGKPSRLAVHLSKEGVKHKRAVHKLVLSAFTGPCPQGMQGRHFPDPDVTNNRLDNLSWSTPLVNQRDRDMHGTHNKGIRNKRVRLDEQAVREIRTFKQWPYGLLTVLAEQYGVTPTCIAYVRDHKSWGHLT